MRLFLNLDFGDLMVVPPDYRIPFACCHGDFYPEEDLRELIKRAVDCGFTDINYRVDGRGYATFRSKVKENAFRHKFPGTLQRYDPLEVAIDAGHQAGARVFAWATPFDNTWEDRDFRGTPKGMGVREAGFSWEHPDYELQSRDGTDRIIGVFSFGYPDVQEYFLKYYDEILSYPVDGIFLSDRTHSNQMPQRVEYGFNEPVIESYARQFGGDPREEAHYDLERFSRVQGQFYTQLIRRLATRVHASNRKLAAKCSWTRNERISGRLGALHRSFFEWETWIDESLVDALVIGGDVATGRDPEFILPNCETTADSVNPEYFRSRTTREAPIYRWLTMQSWGWKEEKELSAPEPKPRAFTHAVVARAVDAVAASGVDGMLMHEAVVVTMQDQWEVYRRFRAAHGPGSLAG